MQKKETQKTLIDVYGSEEEAQYAQTLIQQIDDDLQKREQSSLVFNGLPYTTAYEYNIKKSINYAPPKTKEDREVSIGLVHEKIIGFAAMFLKYGFKRVVKCYEDGKIVNGMGKIYELGIEHSLKAEEFDRKIALIFWEVFSQGNAFVFEDWEVKTFKNKKAFRVDPKTKKKELVTPSNMDYSLEFLEGLTYQEGEMSQHRMAVSRLLDGRSVIFGNPEITDVQDQPRITLEFEYSKADAKKIFGTLSRFKSVPTTTEDITTIVGEKVTLFDVSRLEKPEETYIAHLTLNKEENTFNWFLNGVMLLPSNTSMTLFYPRGNYPLSNIPAERLTGSIYARSVPAKTKFNADFLDWSLKMLANKFQQGIEPAILTNGKYTLTRDIFKGGQVTHGVKREHYEKADPDNRGITQSEFSFVQSLKEIVESQTLNSTSTGELSSGNTAFEIAKVDQAQLEKLGYLLDGIVYGFHQMALRRAETIESKYTTQRDVTIVDGKEIPMYQNFSVNLGGVEHVVDFDSKVGSETYDVEGKRNELFKRAFDDRKSGHPTKYFLANPEEIRKGKTYITVDIYPERIKDSQLRLIEMWNDFKQRLAFFGQDNNIEEMKKEYIETSGKPDTIFTSGTEKKINSMLGQEAGTDMGTLGKPTVKTAQAQPHTL